MRFPLFLEKHVLEDEYTNRLYRPFHFLIVVFGSVNTQGPSTAAGSTPTSSSIRTSGTVVGYGKTYGCPSDVVVSTAPAPNVTIEPKQGSTVVNAHRGDVIEVLMPFGVEWR